MKGKKRSRADALMIQHGEGLGGRGARALLPADASTTVLEARVAAAAEMALILTVESGLLVSWTEAAELQRASLVLCAACRGRIPVRLRVASSTPRGVWARENRGGRMGEGGGKGGKYGKRDSCDQDGQPRRDAKKANQRHRRRHQFQHHQQQQQQQKTGRVERRGCGSSSSVSGSRNSGGGGHGTAAGARLPWLRVSCMLWEAPASHLGDGADLPSEMRELTFGREFNRTLSGLVWPPRLERLTFGSKFNRDLVQTNGRSGLRQQAAAGAVVTGDGVVGRKEKERSNTAVPLCLLPRSLKELSFGKQFNKPLPRTLLPPGLVSLTLGRNFRQRGSVRGVVWPVGIKVVRFGEALLRQERRDWPQLEAMRGLIPSSDDHHGEEEAAAGDFAWPAGLDRVEFWQEGRAVVSLKGGKTLGGDSLEWLTNH